MLEAIASIGDKILLGIFSFLTAMFGWVIKRSYTRMDKIEKDIDDVKDDITSIRVELPTNYATKSDIKDISEQITSFHSDIKEIINTKADK